MKKWIIGSPDPDAVQTLQSRSDLSALCCTVLASEGCITVEQAAQLLGCESLSDPFLLCDMREAADAVNAAVDSGRHICIYGDYDCDGVIATVILYTYLFETGADVTWRIPERSEGYGLNRKAVEEMHEDGVELIITVDNGISAIPEAAYIRELGMELVVTDHHQPGKDLPDAVAVVDAHREDNASPFRLYCGAAVALLLVAALNDGDVEMAMEQFGDLAAIATVADIVPLTGENRCLVQMGLEYLQNTERPGLFALRELCGLGVKTLTAENIAFGIAPRINAAGRLASPRLAVELLLEESPTKAKTLAEQLGKINAQRKTEEESILFQVREAIEAETDLLHERVLVFAGEGWNAGIIGITAARMLERYGKPCIMISLHDGIGHGSARSFGNFSVFDCLTACADLLEKYGGHPAAGGFTIRAENVPAFRERVAAYAEAQHPEMPVQELRAACVLRREFLTLDAAESLSQLAPFGAGNPEPLFAVENAVICDIRPLSGGVHTKLLCEVDGVACEALFFRRSPESTGLRPGDVCHLMVKMQVSTYMNERRISLYVQDLRLSGMKQSRMIAAIQTYDRYRRGEPLTPALYRAVCPDRKDCILVYKSVPKHGIRISQLAAQMYRQDVNYCKMRLCLDILAQLGLLAIEDTETSVRRISGAPHADLEGSAILQTLRRLAAKEEETL